MIEVPFRTPVWVDLVPRAEAVKGLRGGRPAEVIVAPVMLGTPIGQPLNEELAAGDVALKNFLKQNIGSAFHFVQLACSFLPSPNVTFISANLRAQMRHISAASAKPIALGMVP